MTHETWILLVGIASSNIVALIAGLIHISTKLARIETDIKWIKAGCPQCRQTSESPTP